MRRKHPTSVDNAKKCLGFSLVELMVVIAIIAILAATALPLYANYTSKAQLTRVVAEISAYKRPIEIHILNNTINTALQSPTSQIGLVHSNLSTVTLGSFTDSASSYITGTLNGNSNSGIHGTEVTLTRNLDGSWKCTITGAGASWDDSMKPTGCQ